MPANTKSLSIPLLASLSLTVSSLPPEMSITATDLLYFRKLASEFQRELGIHLFV